MITSTSNISNIVLRIINKQYAIVKLSGVVTKPQTTYYIHVTSVCHNTVSVICL